MASDARRGRTLPQPFFKTQPCSPPPQRNLKLPLDDSLRQLSFYSLPKEARLLVDHAPQDEF